MLNDEIGVLRAASRLHGVVLGEAKAVTDGVPVEGELVRGMEAGCCHHGFPDATHPSFSVGVQLPHLSMQMPSAGRSNAAECGER